jgi:hypothetical protein
MKTALRIIFSAVAVFLMVGCSSTLQNVERDNSLDRIEAIKGEKNQDGNFADRQEALAEQSILDREVSADAKKGYRVLIVNHSPRTVRIEIKKSSFFCINPVTASFVFYGDGSKDHYLMPGKYDVECWANNWLLWSKTYEVTTAPNWDDNTKQYYHCIMGNIRDNCYYDNNEYGYSRHYHW